MDVINMKRKMMLNNEPYMKIKDGTKTIELRLNDEKRQMFKIGDIIKFTNRKTFEQMLIEISNLYCYSSFDELYKHFDKVSMGYEIDDVANSKDMEKYYSNEEQEKYGVLGIEVKRYNMY